MSNEVIILVGTAAGIGFIHTLLGPDHYLPFIVLSKARQWSISKTLVITFLCGLGHVGSSIILGIIGIIFGLAITKLELFESFRGNIAAWLLIGFGLIYFLWGLRSGIKNKPHRHIHSHDNELEHTHDHVHNGEHAHIHDAKEKKKLTPWILFIIFVLGPCEPLIPILMYPAAKSSIGGVIWVSSIFALTTIISMTTVVIIALKGINMLPLKSLERYMHAVAGLIIFLSGLGTRSTFGSGIIL